MRILKENISTHQLFTLSININLNKNHNIGDHINKKKIMDHINKTTNLKDHHIII